MRKDAKISLCGKYRYTLSRIWDEPSNAYPILVFIGLNPSIADADINDPTIRRCIGFAKNWGYSGMIMLNLFAYRATDPKDMDKAKDKIGENNDKILTDIALDSNYDVIFCWGQFPQYQWRINQVKKIFPNGKPIALSKKGFPRHPLYLKGALPNPHAEKNELRLLKLRKELKDIQNLKCRYKSMSDFCDPNHCICGRIGRLETQINRLESTLTAENAEKIKGNE